MHGSRSLHGETRATERIDISRSSRPGDERPGPDEASSLEINNSEMFVSSKPSTEIVLQFPNQECTEVITVSSQLGGWLVLRQERSVAVCWLKLLRSFCAFDLFPCLC